MPDNANKLILNPSWKGNDRDYPNGYLTQPNSMMFGSDERIYVSDSREHAVFVFGESGHIINKLGKLGSGPGDFVSPSYIGETSQGKIAVFDSTELKVQVIDTLGHHINSFRVFKPCFSMSTDHRGYLYFSFVDQNDEYPLIDVFDEVGRKVAHIGTRLKGNSPFFNNVDISEVDDGILVAWKTFPLVRKYSISGDLLFEHYLDYGPLKEYGELNKASHPVRGKTDFNNVIWKIRAGKKFYFLLIGYPRLEILQVDLTGKITNTYWDDIPEDFITSDFIVQEEKDRKGIYVLEMQPMPHIRRYYTGK